MKFFKSWRFKWTVNQISTLSNYKKHQQVLVASWKYWLVLVLKFFPGIYNHPIRLKLREGGSFCVVDFMSLYIYNEIFVEKSYDYPDLGIVDPLIIDIGANTGLFTLRMKQLYPEATLLCYEPFPSNFDQLSQNIKQSGLKNVNLINKGAGGKSRSEKLFINKQNIGGHSLFELEARSDEFITIDIQSIGELISNLRQKRIHLIKMDCEGAEYEIIKALDVDLVSDVEVILFESTESVYDLSELLDHLRAIGFSIEFKENSCNYIARNLKFFTL